MTSPPGKTIASSVTETIMLMTPEMSNFGGNVHGGHVLRLIDQISYACASSYSGNYCVTRSVDRVDFRTPVRVGDLLVLQAQVNYVGRTSMEVGVRAESRNVRSGASSHTNSCYLTMVAIDEETKRPTPAPPLVRETDDDRRRFAEAARRRKRARMIRMAEESEARHQEQIEAASVAMLLVDAETGAIVDGNRLARELFGRDEVELAERSLWELYTDPEAGRAVWRDAVHLGFSEGIHEHQVSADTQQVSVTAWSMPMPGKDLVQVVLRPT